MNKKRLRALFFLNKSPNSLPAGEKGFDFALRRLHPPLLAEGFSAAPAMERGGHVPTQLPQVALTGDQAVGVTAVAAAEHCRRAAVPPHLSAIASASSRTPSALKPSSKCRTLPRFP